VNGSLAIKPNKTKLNKDTDDLVKSVARQAMGKKPTKKKKSA